MVKRYCLRGHDTFKVGRTSVRRCKQCARDEAARYRALYPGRVRKAQEDYAKRNPDKNRRWWLKQEYGITIEDFNALLASQGGGCAICETTEPRGNGWHVDHCHESGGIRGVLCHSCNVGIGSLGDTDEAVLRAYKYLAKFYSERKLKLA